MTNQQIASSILSSGIVNDEDEPSEPARHADGRPKTSPDETSLLGLTAVWAELDAAPPKRTSHRRSRHAARREPVVSVPVVAGLAAAVVVALAMIGYLASLVG